jgi:hypothetical protein
MSGIERRRVCCTGPKSEIANRVFLSEHGQARTVSAVDAETAGGVESITISRVTATPLADFAE